MKTRIDKLLVERGLAESRERARALIMAGDVYVESRQLLKAGTAVDAHAEVRLRRREHPFVGRGGVKLRGALDAMRLDPAGWTCADIGCSIGGFTHCLLLSRARRVYAIDVDPSQLDWKLQNDSRVIPVRGNARYMQCSWVPERLDLVTVDVSFISLSKLIPSISGVLGREGRCLALVKPQFELGRGRVPPGGVVTERALQETAVSGVVQSGRSSGLVERDRCASPITGKEGNREFFVLFEKQWPLKP